jgi:hypothetical protein
MHCKKVKQACNFPRVSVTPDFLRSEAATPTSFLMRIRHSSIITSFLCAEKALKEIEENPS